MRKQPKAKRPPKKALVPSKGDLYDVSDDATIGIIEDLEARELTVTYPCGDPPLPPCLPPPPPPPRGILNTKKKKVYVVQDSNKNELTVLVEVTFATRN